jgi:hypothetical protein
VKDADVRRAMLAKLHAKHCSDSGTRVLQEMGVWSGTVRIDIAVVNGELCGYELKSDRDTLDRLPRQVEYYGKVFDRITIVVGAKHAAKAAKLVPAWWGIERAAMSSDGVEIEVVRNPDLNPERDAYVVAELLSKSEALSVLDCFGMAAGWRARRVKDIHIRLSREVPFDELRAHVRAALKCRDFSSRNCRSRDLDVAIHSQANPLFQVSSRGLSGGDLVDSLVGPAMG